MEELERYRERDQRQQICCRHWPEIRSETVPSKIKIVSDITRESHNAAIKNQQSPIWQRLSGEIPIGDFLYNIHISI